MRQSPAASFVLVRAAGVLAVLAGAMQVALFFAGGLGFGERTLVLWWNVAQLPLALALWALLRPASRDVVTVASVAGVGSLVLWAASAVVPTLAPLEAAWIGLSAVWWLGIGLVLRRVRPVLGWLTLAVGVAAIGDALVTVPELMGRPVPDLVFMTVGGFKLPLAMAWTIAIGLALVVAPAGLTAPSLTSDVSRRA